MSAPDAQHAADAVNAADAAGPRLTAIVLAGGRSSRFGADKLAAALPAGGPTILDRTVAAVAQVTRDIVVVGRPPDAVAVPPGARMRALEDPEPFGGPLQAVAGALRAVSTELAIVVAGDMPAVVPAVLELLVDRVRSTSTPAAEAAVLVDPADRERRQPLPFAVRVDAARAAAGAALEAGDRSLVRLLDRLVVAQVEPAAWLALDPDARTLLDVDVPEDLDRVRGGAQDQRMR